MNIILRIFKKYKFKSLIQAMRGYRNIKEAGNLKIIHELKKEISETKLILKSKFTEKLFFLKLDPKKEELIVRQFLISIAKSGCKFEVPSKVIWWPVELAIIKTKEIGARILADNCGQDFDKIMKDFNRDYWMDAKESLEYGIINGILE